MRSNLPQFLRHIALVIVLFLASSGTAWAATTSTINVGGTDYLLFTGFTATGGNGTTYAKFVDGDTATHWIATKNMGEETRDFAGDTEDPAYVEFHADSPVIPKGYVLTCDSENAGFWKPVQWAFKAKLNEGDEWTAIHSSTTTLGAGKTFEIACTNDAGNQYQYFRFEVYEVGATMMVDLDELQIYAQITYTPVSARAATCTEYGLTNDGYLRNDGKYFSDENGTTELTVGNGLIDKIPHTGVHHEADANHIEYWQCSVCSKYFTDEACTHEVTADEVLTSAITNGMVIWVAGSLTVTDSGTGGTIKGGMDSSTEHVSCVKVYSENSNPVFTLQGGTLIGNTSYQYNSAVFGGNNTNTTISGGKITGDVYGIHSYGNVTVSGGEISGNTTGIWSQTNSVSVSGNPVIANNTNANVMLYHGDASVLTIAGELTAGANIGITEGGSNPTDNAPVTITSGYGTYNSNVSPGTYFSLDNNGQIQTSPTEYMTVVMGWNEDKTEIAVGTAMRTVNFDLQGHGSAIEAVSLLSGYKLVEPTEPTAEGWSFGGWYTDEDFTDGNEWDFDSGVTSDMTLCALWTQGQMYRVTLPENMIIVSADNAAVGGKYPSGTNIRFKAAPDYVVDGDVKNGTETLTADGDGIYTVALGNADITITATIKKAAEPNKTLSGSESYTAQNGDVLTGSTSGTVTIPDGASITLSDVSIGGGIVCNGTATITLVGTNSATGATQKAGIEVGGENTTLTIKGNGSLTATGGQHSAGIGLSRAWDPANDVIGGNIVIEGGTITANGNSQWGAGIGTGVIYGNGSAKTARLGNVTIKGGTVTATGGTDADGIGTGYTYNPCTNSIGTVTVYDGIDKVDASSIKDFGSVVYMHDETNVTANKTDYFTIGEDGNRRVIVQKPVVADIPDQSYTGSAITPKPTVTIGSIVLTKGTDYEYSYTDNINAGTNAKVTVTFKGDYASLGSAEKTFTILPCACNTEGGYYEISSPQDLTALATYVNAGNNASGKTFKQTADIDMQGVDFTPIGNDEDTRPFKGTYDGDSYFILNISHSDDGDYALSGLFGLLEGSVRNVNLKDCNFTGRNVGGIAGKSRNESSVQNCNVLGGTITCTGNAQGGHFGGIVGYAYGGTVDGCFTTTTSDGNAVSSGPVVGFTGANVANSYYVNTPSGGEVNSKGEQVTVYNITLGDGITMSGNFRTVGKTADNTYHFGTENDTITLSSTVPAGCAVTYSVNGEAISGNTLTMPAGDVEVTAEFEAVDYSVGGITGGLMGVDKTTAHYGDIVTLTPAKGYKAENVTVKNGDNDVAVTKNEDGTYTFTMPAGGVTVSTSR